MSIRKWWARRRFLRRLDKEGLLVGAGPCEGPTSAEGPSLKYPIVALPASRWFAADVDGLEGKKLAQEGARIALAMSALDRLPGPEGWAERSAYAETREGLMSRRMDAELLFVSAVIVTDTGGQLIYEAGCTTRCAIPSDARHAFFAGQRGFFPLRLLNKALRTPRVMYALDDAAASLADRFNVLSSRAACANPAEIEAMPWLDAAWRSR